MEVARFKYPPHWVPLELLFDAMKVRFLCLSYTNVPPLAQEVDTVTGLSRGYITLRSSQEEESHQELERVRHRV